MFQIINELERRDRLKKLIITVTLFFTLLGLVTVHPMVGKASEFNYSVTPLPSEYQRDKEKTYFDLLLAPNQTTELKVKLRNDTEKEVKGKIAINNATTNSNVIVDYGENALKKDQSLLYDLNELVDYPSSVVLKPKSEQVVTFQIKMPSTTFDGVIAGGITFEEEETSGKPTSNQGLAIDNDYSYIVALLLRQTKKDVSPNLVLHEVKPGQLNARNVIQATLQNDQMAYINQVEITAEIRKKGSDQVLYQVEKEEGQIAPNSTFSLPISLNKQALEPGDYHLSMTVSGNKTDDKPLTYKNQWSFERDFRIDGTTARTLNEKDVTLKKNYTFPFVLIGLLLIGVVILLIFLRRGKIRSE
ncbi:DUF916 and DUF3324 domain-containing protein [Enterococcus raffinosus]|uniref:DUF916 and DUF3324 domain-containing protein n=1 Tax=Enterococcus raffinosus TaxID=71452 RepID=UPI0036F29FB3